MSVSVIVMKIILHCNLNVLYDWLKRYIVSLVVVEGRNLFKYNKKYLNQWM